MDDNTFECPHCGARVYPEMTRCPQCGQNMYPEDEEPTTTEDQSSSSSWVSLLGIIILGGLIAAGIAFLLHYIVAGFANPASLSTSSKAILFLAGPVGAFVGGYVCSMLARRYAIALGVVIGVLTLAVSALLATHWIVVELVTLTNPVAISLAVLVILAGMGGGWLNQVLSQSGDWKERWRVRGWEDLLYQELLRKVRFNGSIADRLIDYERKQEPDASRLKLIQSAIERWERDNR